MHRHDGEVVRKERTGTNAIVLITVSRAGMICFPREASLQGWHTDLAADCAMAFPRP